MTSQMRCPECHTLNEANATACSSCGLLLFKAQPPQRRSEDFASQKRRSSDQVVNCQFCGGDILSSAIRCKHCSEIVNEAFYRERAQRLRSRVNYASWVAYVFGLAALIVFRPVGLLSIAAGLLLSIAYYAIPVEPSASRRSGKKKSLGERLRQQFRMERVAIPIPNFKSKKLVFVGTPLIAALIGYSANLFLLQQPMNEILKQNSAFQGMSVSAHYEYWVVPGVVVYDLRQLSVRQTPIDVHTAFLEFAKKLRSKRLTRVDVSYRGTTKFQIDGSSFQRLGDEYAKRNFDFVLYRFPRLFHSVSRSPQPLSSSDRDALVQFHKQWYGDDKLTRTVANGL
jgi:hypothetical protein